MLRRLHHRYRRSLRARIVVPACVALVAMVLVMALASEHLLRRSLRGAAHDNSRRIARMLATDPGVVLDLSYRDRGAGSRGLRRAFDRFVLATPSAVGFAAYVRDGGALHRAFASDRGGLHPSFPERLDEDVLETRTAELADLPEDRAALVEPVTLTGEGRGAETVGALLCVYSLARADREADSYLAWIQLGGLGVLLLGAWTAMRLAHSVLAPIAVLEDSLASVTDGALDQRISTDRADELGRIAERFNTMAAHLAESRREVHEHARTLEVRVHERTRELARALEELQTLDRAKDRFLSGVSHEMRTPLTAILAAVEILEDFADDDPEARAEFLAMVRRESERLLDQITHLLDLAKIEAHAVVLELAEHDLAGIVREAAAQAAEAAGERGVELVFDGDGPVPFHCDHDRLTRALRNVVDNAVRFSPEGGRVEIALEERDDTRAITVRDHGPGMTRAARRQVFGTLQQQTIVREQDHEGLGLGLRMAIEVVRMHGGDLRYEEPEGGGARFALLLPRDGTPSPVPIATGHADAGGPRP